MAATRETNDRLLLFFRTTAATTELMASGMAASAEIIAPLAAMSHVHNSQSHSLPVEHGAAMSHVVGRHAQSLAVTAGSLRELHGQVAGSLRGLARVVSFCIVVYICANAAPYDSPTLPSTSSLTT